MGDLRSTEDSKAFRKRFCKSSLPMPLAIAASLISISPCGGLCSSYRATVEMLTLRRLLNCCCDSFSVVRNALTPSAIWRFPGVTVPYCTTGRMFLWVSLVGHIVQCQDIL